ncbi:tRNA (adenosine(37)-N6)-threonylcarbamoyltransferase complex ATPase subunit type 1 TsaE [Bacteroidia bacterium]|nr:tRNA (adenosine(37)-N6)-threonylcarbamoyltransferase complex ATPase subunit type 1 TsaE [Bacteroidia bacterium]
MTFEICDIENDHTRMIEYVVSQQKHIYLLYGNLGAGKTTWVKYLVSHLGGDARQVDSPTFSIVNTYEVNGNQIHHFDLYRLESLEEIEDIGFMEYIDSGNLCIIEWPEKIAEFLPTEDILTLNISLHLEKCRKYSFS